MSEDKSAILFLIFNRPDSTRRVFEAIRKYKPSKLYIAADGPRSGITEDQEKCNAARQLVDQVDWACDVKKLFRDHNLGCKIAVSSAITWFFEQEEEGIILEDDCLPGESFFYFCHTLLEKYRHDQRVMHIAGSNLQFGHHRGDASYYFSSIASVWGWAGWKRVWAKYDPDMLLFEEFEREQLMQFVFPDQHIVKWGLDSTRAVFENKINTWDYQLTFSIMINNGLCITPNKNLVSNIGFNADGHLTKNPDDVHANIPIAEIGEIRHPKFFIPNREADLYQLSLSIPKQAAMGSKISIPGRIINKIKTSAKRIYNP